MQTAIIDYGMSNLWSIRQAIEECAGNPLVVTKPSELELATHIILPGVGSYNDGMENLDKRGWIGALRKAAIEDKVPLLGICLGMQLLSDLGHEGGEKKGLGLIHGEVKKLVPKDSSERIPHVGWNEIVIKQESPLVENIPSNTDFYFVHSYHFVATEKESIVAITPYCGDFASIVSNKNIYGVQFHPEKSQRPGFQLLKNFLTL